MSVTAADYTTVLGAGWSGRSGTKARVRGNSCVGIHEREAAQIVVGETSSSDVSATGMK